MLSKFLLDIAGVRIRIEMSQFVPLHESFRPFLAADGQSDYTVCYRLVEELPPIPAEVIHEDLCYRVHPGPDGAHIRSFFDAPRDLIPYAMTYPGEGSGELMVDRKSVV